MELEKFKFCFWDYKNLEKLPDEILAQRFVDYWATIEREFSEGVLDRDDLLFVLKIIAKNINKVKFDEKVKELVIKELIKDFIWRQ